MFCYSALNNYIGIHACSFNKSCCTVFYSVLTCLFLKRDSSAFAKGRDPTQSYKKKPLNQQKNPKRQKHHQTLRLHNDCGPT